MIYNSIIISLLCFGFYRATRHGNILYFIQRFADKLPKIIGKPICLCLTCMASLHTLVWHSILFGISAEIIPTILIVASFNYFIDLIVSNYE